MTLPLFLLSFSLCLQEYQSQHPGYCRTLALRVAHAHHGFKHSRRPSRRRVLPSSGTMTQKLIIGMAARAPRWAGRLHALGSVGSALIAIGSGLSSLSYGLIALGCESLVATVCELAPRLRPATLELPAEEPATELLAS